MGMTVDRPEQDIGALDELARNPTHHVNLILKAAANMLRPGSS